MQLSKFIPIYILNDLVHLILFSNPKVFRKMLAPPSIEKDSFLESIYSDMWNQKPEYKRIKENSIIIS